MSSTLAGTYGGYAPVPGHPLVRIEAYRASDDIVIIWYIADREPMLALGVVPEDRLTWPRKRTTGKGSKPRTGSRMRVDAYWRSDHGQPVRRFRVFMRRTLAEAIQLPGVARALSASRERAASQEAPIRYFEKPLADKPKCQSHLRLVIDNTRRVL